MRRAFLWVTTSQWGIRLCTASAATLYVLVFVTGSWILWVFCAVATLPWLVARLRLRWSAEDERGSATIEFMGLLALMVVPLMCVALVSAWPQRMNAANAAAYQAARAVVEAPDPAAAADVGRNRAIEVLVNHGFDVDDVDVSFSASAPGRGEAFTATVTMTLPLIVFPGAGSWDAVRFSRSSTQRVSDFRSLP